jgi:hypothetical protein
MKNARTRPKSRHIIANTVAGLLLGVGMSLMMTLYGVVPWSSTMPDLIIVLGVVLGLGVGLLPVRTLREPAAPAESPESFTSRTPHTRSTVSARGSSF